MKRSLVLPLLLMMNLSISATEHERVIAHRGASYDAPENTTAAIALAIQQGATIVEFDVRETIDGELFLFHDEDLRRLTGIKGRFSQTTSETASQFDVGSWFEKGNYPNETPPRLAEAIQQCLAGGAIPLIEHKTGSPENYAEVITALEAEEKVIVQSFNWTFLSKLKALLPKLTIGALGKKKLDQPRLLELNPDWVGWSDSDIREQDIKWLKDHHFHVAIWTVNEPRRAAQLLRWGVDKIITDRAAFLKRQLGF